MKKVLLIIVSLLLVLSISCKKNNDNNPTKTEELTTEEIVNSMLDKEYNNIEVTKVISKDDLELNTKYVITKNNDVIRLTYSIEKYNELDIDNPDQEEKSIIKGVIEFNNGKKTVIEGEDLDININSLLLSNLKIDSNDFDEIAFKGNSLVAKTSNGRKYLNSNNDLLDFVITITYQDKIESVKISYKENNYLVTIDFDIK